MEQIRKYEPSLESLGQHQVPDWFHDAKLGIFIHWGLYSVPGWAPHGADIDQQVKAQGWAATFANNPYAEWYLNSYRIGDTPTRRHHIATYGANFSYDDFVPMFNQAVEKWNPEAWASLFKRVGARYVVLTTKHHDGFCLWPSKRTSPYKKGNYAAKRDLVGELAAAVRRQDMRMGLYYSGGLDWSFSETPIRDGPDVRNTIVQTPEFIEYVDFHWRELIEQYAPSILWNDIGYPANADALGLFAHYYNTVPEGLVNDRWAQQPSDRPREPDEPIGPTPSPHSDFTTPEYGSYDKIMAKKWESCRGIGHSFGYNQNEGPDDYISVEKLVRLFVDIVSKNGNLLLDVGPMAGGNIPELQVNRLHGLAAWLDFNGEAIFGTHPWVVAEGKTTGGIDVRFTQKGNALYAILLGMPPEGYFTLEKLQVVEGTKVYWGGRQRESEWVWQDGKLTVAPPTDIVEEPAYTLRIEPQPTYMG